MRLGSAAGSTTLRRSSRSCRRTAVTPCPTAAAAPAARPRGVRIVDRPSGTRCRRPRIPARTIRRRAHTSPCRPTARRAWRPFGEHRGVMAERRRHQHAETDPLGDRCQPGQRRVRLRDVGPRRADLRDLTKVVHHPDVVDAGSLRVRSDRRAGVGQLLASTGQSKLDRCRPDVDVRRLASGAAAGVEATDRRRCRQRRRHDDNRLRRKQIRSHGSATQPRVIDGQRRS